MKKTTKGALAAGAAGTLLLGGAGSLAYWTSGQSIAGGSITSGHLTLTESTPCDTDWQFNGVAFDPVNDRIVPGDTLTRSCTYAVSAIGNNLTAELNVTGGALGGDAALAGQLDLSSSTVTQNAGTPVAFPVAALPIHDQDTIQADLVVTFPDTGAVAQAGNDPAGLTATLAAIVVTATQVP